MTTRRDVLGGLSVAGVGALALGGVQPAIAQPQPPFRILSIDGGGIKGVVPAEILLELDNRLKAAGKKGVAQCFDLFAGTSTGCIIAAALASSPVAPSPGLYEDPQKIIDIYRTKGPVIFERGSGLRERTRVKRTDVFGQLYWSEGKRTAFAEAFGQVTLGQLTRNFVGTFYRMSPGEPGAVIAGAGPLFRSNGAAAHDGYRLCDVVDASSAAPIFFNPAEIKTPYTRGVDGGIFANNPSAAAFFAAGALIDPARIQIVSIGCGRSNVSYPSAVDTWGPVEWAMPKEGIPLINIMADSQSSAIDIQLKGFLGPRYLRLQPSLAGLGKGFGRIDDASPANLDKLRAAARAYTALPDINTQLNQLVASL
jgi:hypothetical protein